MEKKSSEIIVNFSDVTKQYGDLVVLDKLNLEIKKNEMVSIIGPSGSGKTTVLRVLMTLEKINQGVIYLDDEPLTHMDVDGKLVEASEKYLRERRSKIGMVFQQFNLFPHMTALQNCIEAPIEVLGMKKEEAEERALELLELVGLTDKKDQHPSRLSGGQQQRVAVARSLVFDPQVVLMDEPLGALDKNLRESMQYEIKHIHESIGVTVVYVTHDQTEALTMSNRIAVFNDGKVQQLSSPDELYEKPVNSFVAEFIGENNKFLGQVADISGDKCKVKLEDGTEILANPVAVKAKGDKTKVSLRPERAIIDPSDKMDNNHKGKIEEIIYHGDHTRLRVDLLGNKDFILKVPNSTARLDLKKGNVLDIGWNSIDCRALDPK